MTVAVLGLILTGCSRHAQEPPAAKAESASANPFTPTPILRVETPSEFEEFRFVNRGVLPRLSPFIDGGQARGLRLESLTAPCIGYFEVGFPVKPKTRYRAEVDLEIAPGAEFGSPHQLIVEHNLAGEAVTQWMGATNLVVEFNSHAQEEASLQYRLRGFKGTLTFSKLLVTQISPAGSEPSSIYDQTTGLYREHLYRFAVPTNRVSEVIIPGQKPDSKLTSELAGVISRGETETKASVSPGDTVLYSVEDDRLIPSTARGKMREKGIVAFTLLQASKGCLTYCVTLDKPDTWIARYAGTIESGPMLLLHRPDRRLRLFFQERTGELVRYGVSTSRGEVVYYEDPQGRPILPSNDVLASLGLPLGVRAKEGEGNEVAPVLGSTARCGWSRIGSGRGLTHPKVPLTGFVSWSYRSPELDRDLALLGICRNAAEGLPEGRTLRLRTDLRIGIVNKGQSLDPSFFQQMLDAEANLILNAGVLLGASRDFIETAPLWVRGYGPAVVIDEFDAYRSHLLSPTPFVDEPFERSGDYDECVRKDEVRSWADMARLFPPRIRSHWIENRRWFPGETIDAFDTLASMADLHFRAGIEAFWFELYSPGNQAKNLAHQAGRSFADLAAANRAWFAPMRGAASQHGRHWGLGVWVTEPDKNSCGGGEWKEAREALLQAWREGARDLVFYSEAKKTTDHAILLARELNRLLRDTPPEIVVGGRAHRAMVVPPGFAGGGKLRADQPYPRLNTPENRTLMRRYEQKLFEWANCGEPFDVVVEGGAPHPPYEETWRLRDDIEKP